MSGRGREAVVLLLDVGPRMHAHLQYVARAAADYVTSSMLYKAAKREAALTLFGATDTRNCVNAEHPDQYLHVLEACPLSPPDLDFLRALHTLKPGRGRSDFFDALMVAAAQLCAPEVATAAKSILLVSNFCERVGVEPDEVADLAAALQGRGISLEVLRVDAPEDVEWGEDKVHSDNVLTQICLEVPHRERSFASGLDLLSAFKAKEYGVAGYSGPFTLTPKTAIQVKAGSRTMLERFRMPAKETSAQHETGLGGALEDGMAGIDRSTVYEYVNPELQTEQEISAEEVASAYAYGSNLVPIQPEQKEDFNFPAARGFTLVGFVPVDSIPRHYYMGRANVVVADKDRPASGAAFAALVAAMQRQGRDAIVRFLATARSKPALFLARAVAATATAPPLLLMNALPFQEDFRSYKFATFEKKAWAPSAEQLEAARGLLRTMDLGSDPLSEQLVPEGTAHPGIHRLYWELGRKAVQGNDTPLQETDALVQYVFEPRLAEMPGAEDAVQRAWNAFPMGQAAKQSRRSKKLISADNPEQGYYDLLAESGAETAMEALSEVITDIVFGSVSEHGFSRAASLVDLLRSEGVRHACPGPFNDALFGLRRRVDRHQEKKGFWDKLMLREVRPVSEDEAPGGCTQEELATWLVKFTQTQSHH